MVLDHAILEAPFIPFTVVRVVMLVIMLVVKLVLSIVSRATTTT